MTLYGPSQLGPNFTGAPSSQGHLFQDKVPNVELPWFDQRIMVLSHQVHVMCHPLLWIHPYLVNEIED